MKKEQIQQLQTDFEKAVHYHESEKNKVAFWFARDLQTLLDYTQWRNFVQVIDKAQTACEQSGQQVEDHFLEVEIDVPMPKGGSKKTPDIMLTRYACYLIAQNGDPRKEAVAFAMTYFAIQTRKQELLEKRLEEWERLQAREKLSFSEKELSGVIYERGVDGKGFAYIRAMGDKALFGGKSTQDMKDKLGVPPSRPLADFLPTITIKAKDFANEITIFNLRKNERMKGKDPIAKEHQKNNLGVRKLLDDRGIKPELLPAEEDIKKLKRRVASESEKLNRDPEKLGKGEDG